MAAPSRPSPLEPTATDQRTFNRKAAERINFLLQRLADVEARLEALENP